MHVVDLLLAFSVGVSGLRVDMVSIPSAQDQGRIHPGQLGKVMHREGSLNRRQMESPVAKERVRSTQGSDGVAVRDTYQVTYKQSGSTCHTKLQPSKRCSELPSRISSIGNSWWVQIRILVRVAIR